jgi:hypothetical protein
MNKEELDQIIEKSLRTEVDFRLPEDFALKVTSQVVRSEQWKTDLREYLYLVGVLLSLLAAVSGFYYFIDKAFVFKAFAYLSGHLVPVISIIFILNFILLTDKVLLQILFSRWKRT